MTEPNSNSTESSAEAPQIGIVELQNMVSIIDAAAERGAFKGNELTAVGTTRDRVVAFLSAVTPTADPETEVTANNDVVSSEEGTASTTKKAKTKK